MAFASHHAPLHLPAGRIVQTVAAMAQRYLSEFHLFAIRVEFCRLGNATGLRSVRASNPPARDNSFATSLEKIWERQVQIVQSSSRAFRFSHRIFRRPGQPNGFGGSTQQPCEPSGERAGTFLTERTLSVSRSPKSAKAFAHASRTRIMRQGRIDRSGSQKRIAGDGSPGGQRWAEGPAVSPNKVLASSLPRETFRPAVRVPWI